MNRSKRLKCRFTLQIPLSAFIATNPIVKILQIDEFCYPWYEVTWFGENGESEEHILMV